MKHRVKITKEMLEKYMSEKNVELTLAEVELLMESEAAKPEDEMDTELIDMCAAVLAKAYNPDFKEGKPLEMYRPWEDNTVSVKPKGKKVFLLKRILPIAAALVLVFTVILPVGATVFDNKVSDGIIEFYAEFFKINLRSGGPIEGSEADGMSERNIDSFALPRALKRDDYAKLTKVERLDCGTVYYISVHNTKADISGEVIITCYKNQDEVVEYTQVPQKTYRCFKELVVDGQKVFVFGTEEKSSIIYLYGLTDYEIVLDCDFETAVSLAETIKFKG